MTINRYVKYFKKRKLMLINFLFQRILRINSEFPYIVHFTTQINSARKMQIKGGQKTIKSFMQSGNCYFSAYNGIHLGYNVLFAPGIKIITSNHNFNKERESIISEPVIIGDNVWLGTNTIILPEVKIGKNTIIGAGSVVTKDMPENSICVGNPAKIIGWICDCGNKLEKENSVFKCFRCSKNYIENKGIITLFKHMK